MAFRPIFDQYFQGDWPYQQYEGVGLKFSGYPNNIEAFFDLLHQQSCNPVATRRILNELKYNGIKYTTLMSHLNFNYIGDKLAGIGVKMQIVPPVTYNKIQNLDIDRAARELYKDPKTNLENFNLNSEEAQIAQQRALEFKKSIEWYCHHFGPYDHNENIVKEHLKISRQSYNYKLR